MLVLCKAIINLFSKRRQPDFIVRRDKALHWLKSDSKVLQEFILTPSGRKFILILEDSILSDGSEAIFRGMDVGRVSDKCHGRMLEVRRFLKMANLGRKAFDELVHGGPIEDEEENIGPAGKEIYGPGDDDFIDERAHARS